VICLDRTTTGDGLVTALQVLAIMQETQRPLSELVAGMPRLPQVLVNVRTSRSMDIASEPVILDAVRSAETELAGRGLVVLRASGTEPVIRVMVEGSD